MLLMLAKVIHDLTSINECLTMSDLPMRYSYYGLSNSILCDWMYPYNVYSGLQLL